MATVSKEPPTQRLPPLENGDRLDQPTFHARYEAMPPGFRAELIGGIVYMPSRQKRPHGKAQQLAVRWLDAYAEGTPGTEALVNNTQSLFQRGSGGTFAGPFGVTEGIGAPGARGAA